MTATRSRYFDSVLVSADWASREERADPCRPASTGTWSSSTKRTMPGCSDGETGRRRTQLYSLVKRLASPEHFANRALLFLTATPMQLDAHELYSLVELIDPALFPTEDQFEEHRAERPWPEPARRAAA